MALEEDRLGTLVALSMYGPRTAAVRHQIEKMGRRFGRHLKPVEEVRQLVDQSMGSHLLTEELRA